MGEPLNQMKKENLRNLYIQNYVVLEHHHQKGHASYHGPTDKVLEARKGSIQSDLSKNQLPRPCTIWPMHFMVEKLNFR